MFGLQLGRLGIAGLTSWSPAALWPIGAESPGMWIDPAYTPSEFQDSAGTTPISTVGTVLDSSNPVGLILDRKGGLVLGPEINPSGSTWGAGYTLDGELQIPTGWLAYTPGNVSSMTVTPGLLAFSATAHLGGISTGTNKKSVELYVRARKTAQVSGSPSLETISHVDGEGVPSWTPIVPVGATIGQWYEKTIKYTSIAGNVACYLSNFSGAASWEISHYSIREIPGLHLSQSTSAARPVASARKNLLVGTATLSTQSVTVTAIPHTITFSGGGTVTASGTYSGALTSGQTFTPTAGTLTLTVSGSVTSAQLERGSAATSYQAVVSASDYTATGFPVYLKLDGTDDGLASATFSAGTLTSSMDCLIALRRDSTSNTVVGLYNAVADATKYFGMAESGSSSGCVGSGAGTPTVWVDGVQLTGGTAVTRGTLHTALTVGAWHILEFRGLDLSTWTAAGFGVYTSYVLNGALGGIELFAVSSDANRDKARARMAAYFGVTLP